MSFRTRSMGLCYGAGEKTYTLYMINARRISFLLTPMRDPAPYSSTLGF
jgi:hypothetical protein